MACAYSEVHELWLTEPVRPFRESWKMFTSLFMYEVTKVSLQ